MKNMKTLGNGIEVPEELQLPRDLADWAIAVIKSRKYDVSGGFGKIWLQGRKAIKMQDRCFDYFHTVDEARIARELGKPREHGINVPEVYGVYIPQEDEELEPFFVMERLNIVSIDDYARGNVCGHLIRSRLRKELKRQQDLAEKAGYAAMDSSPSRNTGVGRDGKVWLYDFGCFMSIS